MGRLLITLGLFGAVILVANLTFAQDAPSVSSNSQTNSVNSAPGSGSSW